MANEKTRKCRRCKAIGNMSEMAYVEVGVKKVTKHFYHQDCFKEYKKEKEFKEQEAKELDELVEKIGDIFNVKGIPKQAYPLLQEMRNGTRFHGKTKYFYKAGYTYPTIKDTFEYVSDSIIYWLGAKDFDSFMGAFKYSLSIVSDKIHIIEERNKNRENNKKIMEKELENTDFIETKSSYNSEKSEELADLFDYD